MRFSLYFIDLLYISESEYKREFNPIFSDLLESAKEGMWTYRRKQDRRDGIGSGRRGRISN